MPLLKALPLSYKTLFEMHVEREFLKSVRHLLKEVDGFMEFPFHVQCLRISEHQLDCICSQRTVPLQSVWLS